MVHDAKRWNLAQEYEKNWWSKRTDQIDFQFYKNYAQEMLEFGKGHIEITKDKRLLEIGSGAGGIITYLTRSNERFAIDPLEYYYGSVPEFLKQRDNQVHYSTAKGENLSFEDNFFDLIIMDNVLDHCDDPRQVLEEAKRVLKPEGLIYFKQNTYHLWGKFVRFLMEMLIVDKGHPYTFSKKDILRLFGKNGYKILKHKRSGYLGTWIKEAKSGTKKDFIKALLFVTRDKVSYMLMNG